MTGSLSKNIYICIYKYIIYIYTYTQYSTSGDDNDNWDIYMIRQAILRFYVDPPYIYYIVSNDYYHAIVNICIPCVLN